MFNFVYLALDLLLIVLNLILLLCLRFTARTWPLIATAGFASTYLALADFGLFYDWFYWDTTYIFSGRILVYKMMIVTGLLLAILRPPIIILKVPTRWGG